MSDNIKPCNARTPIFRVSYPNVFKPKFNSLSKKEEYSIQALFKKGEDMSALKKAAAEAGAKKWGPDQNKWPKFRSPFKDQGEKTKEGALPDGYEAGAVLMNFKSDAQPAIRDASNTSFITEPSKFYAGCWARASVYALAYGGPGIPPGITFLLNHLQFARDGEPFSGRPNIEEAFAPIEGAAGPDSSAAGIF